MVHLERRLWCKFDQALAHDARRPIRTNYDISRDALARGQQDGGRGRIDRDDARTRANLNTRRARVRAQNLVQIRVLPRRASALSTSARRVRRPRTWHTRNSEPNTSIAALMSFCTPTTSAVSPATKRA
jgi:hypothetical protein